MPATPTRRLQGVLDAEKAALIDTLAGRVGDMQRELSEARTAVDRMSGEGSLSRVTSMMASIASIKSR